MKKQHAIAAGAMLGSALFAACVATPGTPETEETAPPEEVTGTSQLALIKKWGHLTSLRMGGTASETQVRVATDSSGNMIVAGTFSGSMTVGGGATTLTSAGGSDAFVVKLSPGGNVLWSRRLGGTGNDTARSVAVDGSGNVIVVGQMAGPVDFGGGAVSGDAYIAKLNACGTHVWSKGFSPVFAGAWTQPNDVAANAAGTIVFGGMQSGAVDYGGGNILSTGADNMGPFVQSLAADGSVLWGHGGDSASSIEPEPITAVAIDATGNVAVVGDHRFSLTLGTCQTSAVLPYTDVFVMKLGPSGACAWGTTFGATDGQAFDRGIDVAFGAGGAVVVAGMLAGPGTIGGTAVSGDFVASLTPAGAVSWARNMGQARVSAVSTDTAGNVLVGGRFSGTVNVGGGNLVSAGGQDVYFARYTSSNTHLWSARYGNALDQGAASAAAAPNNEAIFAGIFNGSMSLGGDTLASAGGSDLFLARYGVVLVSSLDPTGP